MNMNLSDTTSLKELFDQIESWGNLPASSLSPQQVALINLRNSTLCADSTVKNGGSSILSARIGCFICVTGAAG